MDVEELPPHVRHAGGFGHALVIQARITGVTIRLEDALEPGQVVFRMFALSIRTVTIQHRLRRLAGEGVIVANITPEPSGGCLAIPG